MNSPNFIKARAKASEILLLQDSISFPIDVEKILINNKKIIFSSYDNYAKKTGKNVDDLSCNGQFNDAMIINYSDDLKIILYNSDIKSSGRILWNKAHELGHIVLEHKVQGDIEEIEADTFASQLLLPQCLLKKLLQNDVKVTPDYITNHFGLSKPAAQSCLRLVSNKLENEYDAEYDDIILLKCNDYILNECKKNIRSNYYDSDIEEQRNQWLYDL